MEPLQDSIYGPVVISSVRSNSRTTKNSIRLSILELDTILWDIGDLQC